jgi:hypothetical protein
VRQPSSLNKRYRFPGEVISHAVWLYSRFLLSYGDMEELLAEARDGGELRDHPPLVPEVWPGFADGLRHRRPRPSSTGRRYRLASLPGARSQASRLLHER